MSEVLITLGIIGIVAAMTLPSLVGKYHKRVYVEQLKKTVSTIEQGLRFAIAEDGVDDLRDTQMFSKNYGNFPGFSCSSHDMGDGFNNCDTIFKNLKKYIKVIDVRTFENYKISYMNSDSPFDYSDDNIIVLANGAFLLNYNLGTHDLWKRDDCIQTKNMGGHYCIQMGNIDIDVNDDRKPNIYGRDIFSFQLGENGILYPTNGIDNALLERKPLETNYMYWKNGRTGSCGTPGKSNAESTDGTACAARIIENGWVMDY